MGRDAKKPPSERGHNTSGMDAQREEEHRGRDWTFQALREVPVSAYTVSKREDVVRFSYVRATHFTNPFVFLSDIQLLTPLLPVPRLERRKSMNNAVPLRFMDVIHHEIQVFMRIPDLQQSFLRKCRMAISRKSLQKRKDTGCR